MLITEITTGQLRAYTGIVRASVAGNSATIRTIVHAEGVAHARMLLQHLYGVSNVLNVS